MPSALAWLDYSEYERRSAAEVLKLFSEKDTIDELGIGAVRDALSDLLFPGTNVIQTRARYFLFVPWIYRRLESLGVPSATIAALARKKELDLIGALQESTDRKGIIGARAGRALKILPSAIYWRGLESWGIRQYPRTQSAYHASIDGWRRATRSQLRGEDREIIVGAPPHNWDPSLPSAPADFPGAASFALTREEAEYLSDRILTKCPGTLLARLVADTRRVARIDFPWQHPRLGDIPQRNRDELEHARAFSEIMNGAALLYNHSLARLRHDNERLDDFNARLSEWSASISARSRELSAWSLPSFWELLRSAGARISPPTQYFVERWITLVRSASPSRLARDKDARALVEARERAIKGGLARVANQRQLELWNGDSGSRQLDYRWGSTVQGLLSDINAGQRAEVSRA